MDTSVHISRLSSPCLTRKRGQEAYERLNEYLQVGPVAIDLNNAELLSMSFLDGLVSQLLTFGNADKVTFIVNDRTVLDKLARIVGFRSATLFYRSASEEARHVVPQLAEVRHGATYVPTKVPPEEE